MEGSYIGAMGVETRDDWGAWLAQLMERAIFDLRVIGSSPTVGVEIT